MTAMIDKKKWTNAVQVFSVKKCRYPEYIPSPPARKSAPFTGRALAKPGVLGFAVIDTLSSKHGTFDLEDGAFTVKLAGVYLFYFIGYCSIETGDSASIELRVNGDSVARSVPQVDLYGETYDEDKSDEDKSDVEKTDDKLTSVIVSSLLWLKEEDVVDCSSDQLYLRKKTTRFSGFFFSNE